MGKCVCVSSLGNTGTVKCLTDIKNAKKIFIVPTFDSLGNRNRFQISDALDPAFLTARLNDRDKSKRWRPIGDLENLTDTIADSTFETAASGRKAFIKEGIRSVLLEIWTAAKACAEYLGIIKGMHCTDMSHYVLDNDDNFGGMVPATEDGYLYPIRIDKQSWEAKLIKATDTTQQKISLGFDIDRNERDEQMRWIPASEYTCDFAGAEGLLDIFTDALPISITTTTLKMKMFARFGTAKTKEPMVGLVIGDFVGAYGDIITGKLFNLTTSLDITITTVVENPDGTYEFTFPAQTSGDEIRVTPVKAGYDYEDGVESVVFEIP